MIDWARFGELVVPGVVVGLLMLLAQHFSETISARRKLVSEESWRAKKDAFASAIRLVDQMLTAAEWTGPDISQDHKPAGTPTPLEINSAYAQLMLTAESPEIPQRFVRFFMAGHKSTPLSRGEFIVLLRKELFSTVAPVEPGDVPWVF